MYLQFLFADCEENKPHFTSRLCTLLTAITLLWPKDVQNSLSLAMRWHSVIQRSQVVQPLYRAKPCRGVCTWHSCRFYISLFYFVSHMSITSVSNNRPVAEAVFINIPSLCSNVVSLSNVPTKLPALNNLPYSHRRDRSTQRLLFYAALPSTT